MRTLVAAVLIASTLWAVPAVAEASFNKQAASAQSVSSATLHPPTNLSVSGSGCNITLSWTPTVDARASGYTVYNNGSLLASVTPKTATSRKITFAKNSSYSLTMVTVYLNWTSATSKAVTGSC